MAEPQPTTGSRRNLAHLSTAVGIVLGGLATVFVVRTLTSEWDRVRDALADATWSWMVLGLVLAAAGMTAIAVGWRGVLEMLHARADLRRIIAWYYVGELGKYLPGGVWPVVGRGELARRGGVPRSPAYTSVGLSLIVLYLGAMLTATAALPFALGSEGGLKPALLLILLPLGLVVLHPRVVGPLLTRARALTGRSLEVRIPPWGAMVRAVVQYVPAWLFIGAATWAVARALDPDPSPARVLFATTLAWTAGFLAVPVPAGAGIRETVFIAVSGLDGGIAATTAIAARVLFILVDAGGAALGVPFLRHRGADLEEHEGLDGGDVDGGDVDGEGADEGTGPP